MPLVLGQHISRRQAHDLVQLMAKHGNHYHGQFSTDADVKRFLAASGMDYKSVIEYCRTFTNPVPGFENLIPSTVQSTGGAALSVVDNATGHNIATTQGAGIVALSSYWALFEESYTQFKMAIERTSFTSFLSCTAIGVAAVEAYIQHRAKIYNAMEPQTLLIDDKQNKVSFDDKVDKWIPTMSGGAKLDKGDKLWASFQVIMRYRDGSAIHVRDSALGMDYTELAEGLNHFRHGIAGLLVRLHRMFGERIPAVIIRCSFLPDVIYYDDMAPYNSD